MIELGKDGHVYGADSEDLGKLSLADRLWATTIASCVRCNVIQATNAETFVAEAEKRGQATVAYLGELLERVALGGERP